MYVCEYMFIYVHIYVVVVWRYVGIICFKELSYTIVGAGSFSSQAECLLLFIVAMLGLHHCTRPFSSCGKLWLFSSCDAWASHCGNFSCCEAQILRCVGFSSCHMGVYLSWGMWNLLGSGIESVSHELIGMFSTSGSPGKSYNVFFS